MVDCINHTYKPQHKQKQMWVAVKEETNKHAAWQIHAEAHIRSSRSGSRTPLTDKKKSVIEASYCTKEWSRLHLPCLHLLIEPSPVRTGNERQDTHHLTAPFSLSHSLLAYLSRPARPLSPCLPGCLPVSQRPCRAYLTKQHTTHAASLSPPCSRSFSLSNWENRNS